MREISFDDLWRICQELIWYLLMLLMVHRIKQVTYHPGGFSDHSASVILALGLQRILREIKMNPWTVFI